VVIKPYFIQTYFCIIDVYVCGIASDAKAQERVIINVEHELKRTVASITVVLN
jgi:hypothetical protein